MAPPVARRLHRGKTSFFLPVLGAVLLLSQLAACDIHRAKTHTGKVAPYPTRAHREKGDADGEPVASAPAEPSSDSEGEQPGTRTLEAWTCALLATGLVGLTGIFPLLLPIDVGPDVHSGDGAARFKCLLSFAVGGLLGDVFLHLLPEAWSHVAPGDLSGQMRIGIWVLCGIFTFLVLEKMFGDGKQEQQNEKKPLCHLKGHSSMPSQATPPHTKISERKLPSPEMNSHASPRSKPKSKKRRKTQENGRSSKEGGKHMANGATPNGYYQLVPNGQGVAKARPKVDGKEAGTPIKITGYLNLLANFIDNFTHGLAVAGSFLVSNKVGLLTTAAILLHEVPHEIGDFAILLRSGFNRWQAAKAQVSTAMGGLCGALLALMSESAEKAGDSSAWILPFTSGGFLNIALVTVLPDLLEETSPREGVKQMISLICGVAVMGAVNLIAD